MMQPGMPSPYSQMHQMQESPQAMGGGPAAPELTPEDVVVSNVPYDQGTASARDVVSEVRKRMEQAWNYDRHNREDAISDLKFLAGDQWPEYARVARVNRPMLTINKLPQFLHQVTNDIRKNAPVIKATPVNGKQDPALAKVFDGIINDIQYRSGAKHVYSTAAYHATACGIGHFRVITRYIEEDTFDQEIAVELIPYPLAVYWDPAAVKQDRSDALWCVVVDQVPRETFALKYPKAMQSSVTEHLTGSTTQSGLFWQTRDYVLVAEYWCKHEVQRKLAAFESGETYDITHMDMQTLAQLQMEHGGVAKMRMAKGYEVEQTLVTGAEVLSGPNKWPGRHLPIVPVIGDEVPLERQIVRHGLIRHARDPQALYNFYRSASAEHIALSPKSPYLVTDKMVNNHLGDWNTLNSTNRQYLRYTPDPNAPGNRPERIHAPEPPEALWREGMMATEDIKATTGIYDASLGAKSNETSGVAIKRREAQGDTANFHYEDNLTVSLAYFGRVLIDLIPKIYDNQRMARMMADDGSEQFVPINHTQYTADGHPVMINDLSIGRYDVRVTMGPGYATKRLEAADAIIELMGKLPPEMAAALASTAVKNMDIPDADHVSKILRALSPPAAQNPDQPPPDPLQSNPMARVEFAKAAAEARKAEADANKAEMENVAMFNASMLPQRPPLEQPQDVMGPPPGMPPPGMDDQGMPPQQGGQDQGGMPPMGPPDFAGQPPVPGSDNASFAGGPAP